MLVTSSVYRVNIYMYIYVYNAPRQIRFGVHKEQFIIFDLRNSLSNSADLYRIHIHNSIYNSIDGKIANFGDFD